MMFDFSAPDGVEISQFQAELDAYIEGRQKK